MNDYSPEEPYFSELVIKVDAEKEQAGFIKYIPDEPTDQLDVKNFSGHIEVLNLRNHRVAYNSVTNGLVDSQSASSDCYSQIGLIQHNCTHGGDHAPGTTCDNGLLNDGYYEIVIYTICTLYPQDLNFTAAPDASMGGYTGGGASTLTPEDIAFINFTNALTDQQRDILATTPGLIDYVRDNGVSEESRSFAVQLINEYIDNPNSQSVAFKKELMLLALQEQNKEDIGKLVNIALLVENSGNDFFTDEFEMSLDPYVDTDVAALQTEHFPGLLIMQYHMNYKRLRQLNPEWSRAKCFLEAGKDIVHLSLDVFGLIPVIGEPADLINGVLYTIDGDTVNATLSYASALPIVGYGSAATKFSLKLINSTQTAYTVSTRVKLVWKITSNGVKFGDRAQLRKVLGLPIGNVKQAHHIIPWEFCNNPLVQKAANSSHSFHMNEVLNGIALPSTNHLTGHNLYNQKINQILTSLLQSNPNMSPNTAFNHIQAITNQIKSHIANHPNYNLGQITNLIQYP